jgi:hypothetical protein
MKFAYGKKQKVNDVELDKLFLDLQAVLQKHPVVPAEDIDALVSEWINDILFVIGKITDEELQDWFSTGNANIGIVTGSISGIDVVDYDSQEALELAGSFPQTPLVKTGKEYGYHGYYCHKDGTRNFQKRDDIPGLDLRGDGGYVVAPPSVHESGVQYQWVTGMGLDDLPMAELPDFILSKRADDKIPLSEIYRGVSEGSRNHSLARLAGSWVNDGLTFEECLENANLWNSKNTPPLPETEVETTVKSIYERHHRE